MRKLEIAQKILAAGASLFGLLSALAFFLVPTADSIRFRYFVVFLLRSAIFEFVVLGIAFALVWVMVRLLRTAFSSEYAYRDGWTPRKYQLTVAWLGVLAIAMTFVARPAGAILHARYAYWTRFSRAAYARHDLTRIKRLARTGRIGQAAILANTTYGVLKNTTDADILISVVQSLAARVSRAHDLAAETSPAAARSWNPIALPQRYFQLAEAVRLNPQEYTAAEALRTMQANLVSNAIPADIRAVCSRAALSPARRTLSQLESEVRIERMKASRDTKQGVSECVQSLQNKWSLRRVSCILAVSNRTRRPFKTSEEDEWNFDQLPECRGLGAESVSLD